MQRCAFIFYVFVSVSETLCTCRCLVFLPHGIQGHASMNYFLPACSDGLRLGLAWWSNYYWNAGKSNKVGLSETNQANQINQINQTTQTNSTTVQQHRTSQHHSIIFIPQIKRNKPEKSEISKKIKSNKTNQTNKPNKQRKSTTVQDIATSEQQNKAKTMI